MLHLVTIAVACAVTVSSVAYAQRPRQNRTGEVAGPRDEIVCRRFVRTGSLADFYRVCKTRGEWDRDRQNVRDVTNRNSCLSEGGLGATGSVYGGQVQCGI